MGDNTADTSVADAVPASDSAAKRLTGDERRREILDAVRTVSSELGVSHLSVSAVTKRAGCTRSLFYHYFADMDAAVTAVMDEAIDGFISELEQWNASRTVGDIEGALDTVSLINVNFTFKVMFIGSIIILFINARLVKKWNVEN